MLSCWAWKYFYNLGAKFVYLNIKGKYNNCAKSDIKIPNQIMSLWGL